MAIRHPLKTVETFTDANDTGTGSVSGEIQHDFTLPGDTDNVVVKVSASVAGTGISAVLQTTDDGGTTYYDMARTSIVSNAVAGTTAEWLTGGTITDGGAYVGATNAIAAEASSGLPLLSKKGRVAIIIAGDVTSAASNSIVTEVMTGNQANTA